MSPESFLSSVVEVAIGMAGFAGIVAAIRQRGVSAWPPRQRLLLQALFGASAAAVTFALAPAFVLDQWAEHGLAWRILSALIVTMLIAAAVFRRSQTRRAGIEFAIPPLLAVWAVIVVAVQVANVVWLGSIWPYLFGVFAFLVNGFWIFLMLLLDPSESDTNG